MVLSLVGTPIAAALGLHKSAWASLTETWAKAPAGDGPLPANGVETGARLTDALVADDAAWPARPLPACVARPEQTEGPYFVDERLNRYDIRIDPSSGKASDGVPMKLRFNVFRVENTDCSPLGGVVVDVWHCDAVGVYSDVQDPSFNTKGKKYLRGYQVTDAEGKAEFQTIYPGWYPGRTVHIHFKIRTDPDAQRGFEFTSQLYFDDTVSDSVFTKAPYAAKGRRDLKNNGDGIYRQGGTQLMVTLTEDGDGYLATFDIGLEGVPPLPTATPGAEPTSAPTAPPTGVPPTDEPSPTAMPTLAPTSTRVPTVAPSSTPEVAERHHVYLPRVNRK